MRPIDPNNLLTLADDSLDACNGDLRVSANSNARSIGRDRFISRVFHRLQLDTYPRMNDLEIFANQHEIATSFQQFLDQKSMEASEVFDSPGFSYIVELKKVCLLDNEIRFPDLDWGTLLENLHPGKIKRPDKTGPTATNPAEMGSDDLPTLYLSCPGGPNWGHFVLEDLPRAVLFVSTLRSNRFRFVMVDFDAINPGINRKRSEMLSSLFPECEIETRFHKSTEMALYETIWYVSPTADHPGYHWPRGFVDLRERVLKSANPTKISSEKLLILRRNNRLPIDEDLNQLISWCEKAGFQPIYPEDFSGLEQAWLFASAKQIIGLSGGAMTNLVFSESGIKVLTISPDTWRVFLYRDLAAIMNAKFNIYYGTSIASPDLIERNFNYSLDFDKLIPVLESFDKTV